MARKPKGRGRKTVAARKSVRRKPVKQSLPALAMSVDEWCEAYGVGRFTFYQLLRQGRAPATLKLGRRRVITFEANQRWQREREATETAALKREATAEAAA
jgi:excisionase family DNA binding protein